MCLYASILPHHSTSACMPVFSLTIKLLSICQYSPPHFNFYLYASILPHISTSICMPVFSPTIQLLSASILPHNSTSVCMPVFSPTIQHLSVCQYSPPQFNFCLYASILPHNSTSVSKACFLTYYSILVCILVFNQQFSQHGSNMRDVLYAH